MATTAGADAVDCGHVCVAVVVTGCGSGAVQIDADDATSDTGAPTRTSSTDGSTDNGNGNNVEEDEDEFPFSLPAGDTSVSVNESVLYSPLRQGECDRAQRLLDGSPDDSPPPLWPGLLSPRNVLLFQAAVYACQGRRSAARGLFGRAGAEYGWGGTPPDGLVCAVYQAVGSTLEQRPPSAFACQGGDPPPWEQASVPRDDPRTTDVDESMSSDDGDATESPDPNESPDPPESPNDTSSPSSSPAPS